MGARASPRGQRTEPVPATDRGVEFVEALESVSRGIHDPVAKLRYIRGSLSRYQAIDRAVKTVPWAPGRRLLYRWLSLDGLSHLLSTNPMGGAIPISQTNRRGVVLGRAAMIAAIVTAMFGLVVLGVSGYRLAQDAYAAVPATAPAASVPPPTQVETPVLPLPQGVAPAAIWLVEKGEGWEQYSNGLRIDTSHTTAGERRHFRVFVEPGGLEGPWQEKPIGLIFHTSESDVWPLEATFNENLRDSSQRLLRYVARNRLYNYLIDRFGRVYRVVDEASKANHAGHGVWARGDHIFLNMNHAFLGISFETRWEGGRALPITQAQFAAGRSLSDYLRQSYEIAPDMCVTHGLVSVNPKTHLIGHHLDWSRGFPFAAFGLPDQYAREAPSVARFGFGYDVDFLKVLGEPWPGVKSAETALAEQASRQGVSVGEVRRQRQDLYDRWLVEQTRDQEASRPVAQEAAGSPRSGG